MNSGFCCRQVTADNQAILITFIKMDKGDWKGLMKDKRDVNRDWGNQDETEHKSIIF